MGDEDWDTELTGTSFVPDYSKLENAKERASNYNQSSNLRGGNDELRNSDPPIRGGFGAGRGFGSQRGHSGFGERNTWLPRNGSSRTEGALDDSTRRDQHRVEPFHGRKGFGTQQGGDDEFNKSATRSRTAFGAGRGFGSQRGSNDDAQQSGFSRTGGFRGAKVEGGFGDRNTGRGGGHSEDGFGERRGRGIGRGMRGGFSRIDEKNGAEQHQIGNFGSKFGSGSQTRTDDEDSVRGGGFGGRGGYKGRNEDVGSGSGKGPWKSDEERERGDGLGPKVSFYVPPPPPEAEDTIFAHYQTGINFDKYDEILVEVTGHEPPPAILTFAEANLCETLNRNISKAGYIKLTPVQKYSIPIVLAGRDLMACAQTGSGKTAAFLLPILAHMMRDGVTATSFADLQEPEAIIVAPTRELINQIYLDARKFAYGTCVRPVVIYGGTQTFHSIRQIHQGCNILCATPGRLIDIINRNTIGLAKLKYLVLDEADRMLDMGFGPDMKKLISSPGMPTKAERQTLMFSATFPGDIQRMAGEFLKSDYLFVVVGQVGGACSDVEQRILQVSRFEKKDKLIEILQGLGKERTMVFAGTKKMADYLTTLLCQENVLATSIHGDRLQKEREEALYDFRTGKCNVLVATNVAARGLDIENVQHVINYDLSDNIDEYVHRIGRTGRCGNVGKAITFFDSAQDLNLARSLVKVLSDAQQEVPLWLEEIAFSAHGTSTFSSSRGNVFASVDSRKDAAFNTVNHALSAFAADDDASWD